MLPVQRQNKILSEVSSRGAVSIKALSDRFDVSEMTIRRDLQSLEERGFVSRTHGGAVSTTASDIEPHYTSKQKLHAGRKTKIARYAAENFVEDGDVIILEGGTTVTGMARFLGQKSLTIVSNGLVTLRELQHLLERASIIGCGGVLRDVSLTFVGPVGEAFFKEFHANKVFLSSSGITAKAGLTDPSMVETQVKKEMRASADQVIVLADSSKFGVKSLCTVLPIQDIDVLITDDAAPIELVKVIRDAGVDVRLVSDSGDTAFESDGRTP